MENSEEALKIEKILDDILPSRDLSLVSVKNIRKDVADKLNVNESYFSDNKEKKKLLKTILKEKIIKLYSQNTGEFKQNDIKSENDGKNNDNDDSDKKEKEEAKKRKKKQQEQNVKLLQKNEDDEDFNEEKEEEEEEEENLNGSLKKKKSTKKRHIQNNDEEKTPKSKRKSDSSSGKIKSAHITKKEKLRKLVLDLKIGPTIFKDLNKDDEEIYNQELEKRIIQFCEKKNICSEKNRLPNANEIHEYRKNKKLSEELDGIDPSNIIDSTTRPRRRNQNMYVAPKIPELDDDEEEEEEEEEGEEEEEAEEAEVEEEEADEEEEEEEEEEEDEDDEEEEEETDDDQIQKKKKQKKNRLKKMIDEEDDKEE